MDTGLAGKRVLVTGGGGGIGSACVRAFAAEGAHVASTTARAATAPRSSPRETGGVALQADLTDEAEVERLFYEATGALGQVDVCAAVAGVLAARRRAGLAAPARALGGDAPARTSRRRSSPRAAFSARSKRTGHGNLVLVGSTAGRFGEAGHADYAAAKAAIQVGLLLSLKNEIVRIAPAAASTRSRRAGRHSPMTRGELEDEFVERLSRTMALRKVAQAEDIARAVVVLASDELSGHVTGELVTVAGGMEGRTVHEPA